MSHKLKNAIALHKMWQNGQLGGEAMPEDVHPELPKNSAELLHYLTLGMCLNYQRNSYALWIACTKTFNDNKTRWVFDPSLVAQSTEDLLRPALLKYKVALQPNKHINNWYRIANGIVKFGNGDMRDILAQNNHDIVKIRDFIQINRKDFPYLAGNKICNYWLFVLLQYTGFPIHNRQALTVAPDRHILNASVKLELLCQDDLSKANVQIQCSILWQQLFANSDLQPIDIHTPLWLWSRLGFPEIKP